MVNKQWLPHLTNEMMIGARNNNLCSYLIALEGWRRGLTLTWYSQLVKKRGVHAPGRLFSLSSENQTFFFYKTKGDYVSQQAIGITRNKDVAKEWLDKHGVPVPKGKRFLEDVQNEEILEFAKNLGYPVVLKPTNGDRGVGVVANIKNEEHLKDALEYVRSNFTDIIVEKFIPGEEFRVFVVENKVISALRRIPANVVGDGVHSIKKLIDMKNEERKKNPRLYSCLIKIDHEVKSHAKLAGFSLDDIPPQGKQVFLRENTNISTGGDSVDITDELPVEIKNVAINALKAIPNLPHAGVDVIVNPDIPIDQAGFVIEINAVPQIGSLVFPMIGQARDVPGALIDYYFPETKNKKTYHSSVYFDFREVLRPLMSRSASEVTVVPAPVEPLYAKRYIVDGTVQGVGYRRWIRRKALESNLYGYVRNLKNGTVVVVVAGAEEDVRQFKVTCTKKRGSLDATVISEKEWKKPIKVGFEIKRDQRRVTKKSNIKKATPNKSKVKKKKSLFKKVKKALFK